MLTIVKGVTQMSLQLNTLLSLVGDELRNGESERGISSSKKARTTQKYVPIAPLPQQMEVIATATIGSSPSSPQGNFCPI
jgi:hypothetical protein